MSCFSVTFYLSLFKTGLIFLIFFKIIVQKSQLILETEKMLFLFKKTAQRFGTVTKNDNEITLCSYLLLQLHSSFFLINGF